MNLQIFTKWYVKYLLFALCCVLLLVVPLFKGPWVGSDPFLYYRLAQNPSWYDSLSAGGRFASYAWGNALILYSSPGVLLQALPFLLGVLSFLVFRKIVSRYTQDILFLNLASLFFLLSPTFIYTFSFLNNLYLALFLSLSGFYFFIQKNKKWICIPIILVLPLCNLVVTFLFVVLLFFYSFFSKKDRKKFFFVLTFFALLSSAVYYGYILNHTGYPQFLSLGTVQNFSFFEKLFFDLGSAYGLGIFLTLLAGIGISTFWNEKYSYLFYFFSIFFLLVFALIQPEALLFLSVFFVLLATKGFIELFNLRWESMQYKHFIILIIFSGLAFSSLSQLTNLVESEPNHAQLQAIQFLSQQEPGVVFSDYTRGVWINAAGHENVLDENYLFLPDAQERYTDSRQLFYSRDLDNTTDLFDKYNITYIWIDSSMKDNIWKYDTEGLLFILEYTKEYLKIYDKDGVQIWKVR